jgi:ABC-type multidrug transport system fused ATPase/permease subunit
MDGQLVIKIIFAFIILILFVNMIKFIINFFSNRKRYVEAYDIRQEVHTQVRPHLSSLEKKFEKEAKEGEKFGTYVFGLFKDKFEGKNEKMVEKEICRCCEGYENAECKEDYCLAGSGASCDK